MHYTGQKFCSPDAYVPLPNLFTLDELLARPWFSSLFTIKTKLVRYKSTAVYTFNVKIIIK